MPERVGESPAERVGPVGPSRPTPHRPSRPSSAPSTDLRRPRPLNVHAIPPLPLCGFSVDESIGRSTPHCRALRTVGDSAEGPVGCAPGSVVKARPMDRRRFGHRGWANARGVGPHLSRASIGGIRLPRPTLLRSGGRHGEGFRSETTRRHMSPRVPLRSVTPIGRRVTERPRGETVDLVAFGSRPDLAGTRPCPVVTTVVTASGMSAKGGRPDERSCTGEPRPWPMHRPRRLLG